MVGQRLLRDRRYSAFFLSVNVIHRILLCHFRTTFSVRTYTPTYYNGTRDICLLLKMWTSVNSSCSSLSFVTACYVIGYGVALVGGILPKTVAYFIIRVGVFVAILDNSITLCQRSGFRPFLYSRTSRSEIAFSGRRIIGWRCSEVTSYPEAETFFWSRWGLLKACALRAAL